MTAAAQRLAALLPDFGTPGAVTPSTPASSHVIRAAAQPNTVAKPKQPDIATLIADAVTQAESLLHERLEAEYQAQIAGRQQEHEAAIEALRLEAAQREADLIAVKLGFLEKHIVDTVSGAVGQVLVQALSEPLHAQALNAFIPALKTLMADENALRIEISGPANMIAVLKMRLSNQGWSIVWRETDTLDVTASCNGQVIGTRLGEWSKTLSGLFS
ncbi:hypothetical protein [Limoniibacter endophyticus]|uniref:Flagellar biosynthesis/type III secretory pathway protein FliH n=1 Tax=Limoniibacter endophyticus TaxID=1565040 RepID=A0A8J3DLJ9_9HYPH|nr:hypothetical protein [Limoniibacter endophyticus]GHC64526.1 hypothetical protein GCM10010136_06550 [Limoniibacter endophyticus]